MENAHSNGSKETRRPTTTVERTRKNAFHDKDNEDKSTAISTVERGGKKRPPTRAART